MEKLFEKSLKKIEITSFDFERSLSEEIFWEDRLIGIKGQRGVGKTTFLLQNLKKNFRNDYSSLYVSLDDIYFSANRLTDLVDTFVKNGGRQLFLDEVHKYPNWSQELKNFYDDFPDLKIVFTGSSLLEILNARADLSRRSAVYNMQGLSFREYLNFGLQKNYAQLSLDSILQNHVETAVTINKDIKPIKYFNEYLKEGYFPFFQTYKHNYHSRIDEIINMILDIELPAQRAMNQSSIRKIKQLLFIISQSVPFKPNISKISEQIGVHRNTLTQYFHILEEAKITQNLFSDSFGITALQKPEKIYLENSNFIYALDQHQPNIGNIRETFFANQLSYKHRVTYSKEADFLIDGKLTFEIGGQKKSQKQISQTPDAYIAADDIEIGYKNKIPLWLFGFLY